MTKKITIPLKQGTSLYKVVTLQTKLKVLSGVHPYSGVKTYTDSIVPIDLSGCDAYGSIKDTYTGDTLAEFDITIASPSKGVLLVHLDRDIINTLILESTSVNSTNMGVFDVVVEKNGQFARVLEGTITKDMGVSIDTPTKAPTILLEGSISSTSEDLEIVKPTSIRAYNISPYLVDSEGNLVDYSGVLMDIMTKDNVDGEYSTSFAKVGDNEGREVSSTYIKITVSSIPSDSTLKFRLEGLR